MNEPKPEDEKPAAEIRGGDRPEDFIPATAKQVREEIYRIGRLESDDEDAEDD